jgi:hypothetical protein
VPVDAEVILPEPRTHLHGEQCVEEDAAAEHHRAEARRLPKAAANLSDDINQRRVEAAGDEGGVHPSTGFLGNGCDERARVNDKRRISRVDGKGKRVGPGWRHS